MQPTSRKVRMANVGSIVKLGTGLGELWGAGDLVLSDRASSQVLLGVPANRCGRHQSHAVAVLGYIPLSPGHSSLRLLLSQIRPKSANPTS